MIKIIKLLSLIFTLFLCTSVSFAQDLAQGIPCEAALARAKKIYHHLSQTALNLSKIRRTLPLDFECGEQFNAQANMDGIRFSEAYVFTLSQDDQIAAILAHEIAHTYTFNAPLDSDQVRSQQVSPLPDDQYKNETEADIQGIYLMAAAGYSPFAAVTALEEITRIDGDTDDDSHLPFLERKKVLEKTISAMLKP